ncbi:hypothetical protein ABW20_dc0108787 [Dactylellina cionopaga]|nr:hypothetical protein ABW20_dc0108787 [Dactylellina cionopaga]
MPLTSLPPELLSLILTHLDLKDTFSFLRTCKALYPISHRHLWSTLHLCDRIPLKYKGPPCPPFVHNPFNAIGNDGCRRLAKAIREFGDDKLGFEYIRGLVLEPEVFARSTACMKDGVLKVLGDRIEAGDVGITWVKVSVWSSYLETSDDPPAGIERFLRILKRYSEGKTAEEFSSILDVNFIASISPWYSPKCSLFDLIDTTKITSLDLQLDLYDDEDEEGELLMSNSQENEGDNAEDGDSDADDEDATDTTPMVEGIAAKQIRDLTRLLTEAVNLRTMKLVTDSEDRPYTPPPIYKLAHLLNKLQTAFTGLKRLNWLYLRGEIFHPSFFIAPPENVRDLKIKCIVSVAWWRRFAACPLTGVRDLTIYNRPVERGGWMSGKDEDDYDAMGDEVTGLWWLPLPFDVNEVKVEGLRTLWVQGGFTPGDFVECIVKQCRGPIEVVEGTGLSAIGSS